MALTGIAAEVTKPMVGVLLVERDPGILDREYGDPEAPTSVFEETVSQIVPEVISVVGPSPTGVVRDLAVQCIAYGVASSVEYAMFPEQQTAGDVGRGYFLKLKFNELLATLRSMPATGPGGLATGLSRASFPPARPYPDPAQHDRYGYRPYR
ncbi:hypothetical protein N8K70_03920 [Microbacterium betulae]|uniref:Uncharacterized protein n=1 Tax=Microbacterium betulae TaxID=2981139 RepID=A0AA97FJD8_9MICO|nr:hypothetical protein [Microbacterium sp. AB]WOF23838.1 hypothetical protein N8K70_03920 [Microbacterium sp. AB]